MFKFDSVVLATTNLCNLRCRHCYPSSGPSSEDVYKFGTTKTMTAKQAEHYICQIPSLENVERRLHLAGGESTLFAKELKEIISLGSRYNFTVSLVTNCYWARDQKRADDFICDLKESGLSSIQMSLSLFHQEFLDVGYAIRAIRASKKFGLEIILRAIVVQSHTTANILKNIPSKDLEGISTAVSLCSRYGRAKEAVPCKDFYYNDLKYCNCRSGLNLTIRHDGSVYLCCCGSDITDSLCIGDANIESLQDIIVRAELDPLLNILVFQGPRYLAEVFREQGGSDLTKERYTNICHLCNELFLDNKMAHNVRAALNKHLQKKGHEYLTANRLTTV